MNVMDEIKDSKELEATRCVICRMGGCLEETKGKRSVANYKM